MCHCISVANYNNFVCDYCYKGLAFNIRNLQKFR